jgi:hypothetical protein
MRKLLVAVLFVAVAKEAAGVEAPVFVLETTTAPMPVLSL